MSRHWGEAVAVLMRRLSISAAIALGLAAAPQALQAAEFGTSIYPKGFRDIYSGIVPTVPGLYVLNDAYRFEGDASAVVFNGRVQLDVEVQSTADLLVLTYVPKWKLLGGTPSFALAPSFMSTDVTIGVGFNPVNPLLVPLDIGIGDSQMNFGDTAISPITIGWHAGHWYWALGVLGVIPTGDYDVRNLANTSLNRWGVIPNVGITYLGHQGKWQASSMFAYAISFENEDTNYDTGDIFHNDSSVTVNFGKIGVGAVGYAMIQTTGDSGAGAQLGAFESRVYGAGPILTYTLGDNPVTALTLVAKWYHDFGARRTFEGDTVVASASFKF